MGLWLEQRDESGKLLRRERFANGIVEKWEDFPINLAGIVSIQSAREVCRGTAHLPPERRPWALRIGFSG